MEVGLLRGWVGHGGGGVEGAHHRTTGMLALPAAPEWAIRQRGHWWPHICGPLRKYSLAAPATERSTAWRPQPLKEVRHGGPSH